MTFTDNFGNPKGLLGWLLMYLVCALHLVEKDEVVR